MKNKEKMKKVAGVSAHLAKDIKTSGGSIARKAEMRWRYGGLEMSNAWLSWNAMALLRAVSHAQKVFEIMDQRLVLGNVYEV